MDAYTASIYQDMTAMYEALRSYIDRGTVTVKDQDGTITSQFAFATHFKKPHFYRFELSLIDRTEPAVLWCDGAETYLKRYTDEKPTTKSDISSGLASLTGRSQGAPLPIYAMLLDDEDQITRKKWSGISNGVHQGIVEIDGQSCHKILAGANNYLYIAKDRLTIQRIERYMQVTGISVEKLLRPNRFGSVSGFRFWLKAKLETIKDPEFGQAQDFEQYTTIDYGEVCLNLAIPDHVFAE